MATRACDVGAVARMIGRDDASGLVGVSGFSGSDTALLAERLRERFEGSTTVSVDLLADADPHEMTTTWASAQRQRLEQLRQPGVVVFVEGRGILHPDLIRLFDTTIWMDVGIEDAVMAARLRAFHESRRRGSSPSAEWRAHRPDGPVPPRVEVDVREAELFARFRPDQWADVLFVPVGDLESPVIIRCFAEIGCDFLLWDSRNAYCGELEGLLPIPDDLRARLLTLGRMYGRFEGTPARGDWPGSGAAEEQARALAVELQDALGPEYRVHG